MISAGGARGQPAPGGPPQPPPNLPSADFTREYNAGVDAYRLGKRDLARDHLQKARELGPQFPGPHRFLAALAADEHRWDDCIASARTAIDLNPQSTEGAATRKLHDDCRAAENRLPFTGEYGTGGAIAVDSDTAGATVTIAGLKYGATPLAPRAFAAGEVTVTVQKPGYQDATATVRIIPGIVTDVIVKLEAVGGTGDGDHVTPPVADAGWLIVGAPPGAEVLIDGKAVALDARGRYQLAPGPHQVDVSAPDRVPVRKTARVSTGQETRLAITLPSRSAADHQKKLGRIAVATAAGLGVLGAVTAVWSGREQDRARDLWQIEVDRPATEPLSESGMIAPVHTRADLQAITDRSKQLALASNLSYGLAAVSLGVGIYLLARSPERPPPATIGAMITPEATGVAWGVAVSGVLP